MPYELGGVDGEGFDDDGTLTVPDDPVALGPGLRAAPSLASDDDDTGGGGGGVLCVSGKPAKGVSTKSADRSVSGSIEDGGGGGGNGGGEEKLVGE